MIVNVCGKKITKPIGCDAKHCIYNHKAKCKLAYIRLVCDSYKSRFGDIIRGESKMLQNIVQVGVFTVGVLVFLVVGLLLIHFQKV